MSAGSALGYFDGSGGGIVRAEAPLSPLPAPHERGKPSLARVCRGPFNGRRCPPASPCCYCGPGAYRAAGLHMHHRRHEAERRRAGGTMRAHFAVTARWTSYDKPPMASHHEDMLQTLHEALHSARESLEEPDTGDVTNDARAAAAAMYACSLVERSQHQGAIPEELHAQASALAARARVTLRANRTELERLCVEQIDVPLDNSEIGASNEDLVGLDDFAGEKELLVVLHTPGLCNNHLLPAVLDSYGVAARDQKRALVVPAELARWALTCCVNQPYYDGGGWSVPNNTAAALGYARVPRPVGNVDGVDFCVVDTALGVWEPGQRRSLYKDFSTCVRAAEALTHRP